MTILHDDSTPTMSNSTHSGDLMRSIADRLTPCGFQARNAGSDIVVDGDLRLVANGPEDERCQLWVSDTAYLEWQYRAPASGADPKKIAELATMLLTGRVEEYPSSEDGYGRQSVTFKRAVGRELKARGFDVSLSVYEDAEAYDVTTEIVVTNPDVEDDSKVRISDDGTLIWERDYWSEAVIITPEPEYSWHFADTAKLAETIAADVIRIASHAIPAIMPA